MKLFQPPLGAIGSGFRAQWLTIPFDGEGSPVTPTECIEEQRQLAYCAVNRFTGALKRIANRLTRFR